MRFNMLREGGGERQTPPRSRPSAISRSSRPQRGKRLKWRSQSANAFYAFRGEAPATGVCTRPRSRALCRYSSSSSPSCSSALAKSLSSCGLHQICCLTNSCVLRSYLLYCTQALTDSYSRSGRKPASSPGTNFFLTQVVTWNLPIRFLLTGPFFSSSIFTTSSTPVFAGICFGCPSRCT